MQLHRKWCLKIHVSLCPLNAVRAVITTEKTCLKKGRICKNTVILPETTGKYVSRDFWVTRNEMCVALPRTKGLVPCERPLVQVSWSKCTSRPHKHLWGDSALIRIPCAGGRLRLKRPASPPIGICSSLRMPSTAHLSLRHWLSRSVIINYNLILLKSLG